MKSFCRALIFMLLISFTSRQGNAQCIIDSTQTAAGVYPDTLPDATAGQPYSIDITFVMLTDTLGLTIYNYQILSVAGLPVGLNWQCNAAAGGCNYDPSVSVYGCVLVSGTPLVAGTYTMTVTVVADVQLVGQQVIPFDVPLTVLPGVVTNPGFSMVNASGCDPLTVDFINNNPGQNAYLWDFGNGLQSTLENPPSQTYNAPGTYVVTQTVTPNVVPSWFLTNIEVTSIPDNYGGFVDDPDLYFLLYDTAGVQVFDSRPSIDNTFPPVSWGVPNLPLQNGDYTVHVWDEDGGLFGADDDLGTITFAGHGASGSGTGTVSGASGLLIVNYNIFQTPIVPLTATDTVYVYATPVVPTVTPAGPITVCEGTPLTLTASDTVNALQWYESGVLLPGETGLEFTPVASGTYSVTATTAVGCQSESAPVAVVINPLPSKPTFFVNGNVFTTGVTGLNLQWYYNGVPLSGQTSSTLTASLNGTYQLCGTDANGCENCSDTLVFVNVGVEEVKGTDFVLFPNPSTGAFQMILSQPAAEATRLEISDIAGKIVFQSVVSGLSKVELDLNLAKGVYLVSLNQEGTKSTQKLTILE